MSSASWSQLEVPMPWLISGSAVAAPGAPAMTSAAKPSAAQGALLNLIVIPFDLREIPKAVLQQRSNNAKRSLFAQLVLIRLFHMVQGRWKLVSRRPVINSHSSSSKKLIGPPRAIAWACNLALTSAYTARYTAVMMLGPTQTLPCPRISATLLDPKTRASAAPCLALRIKRSVMPSQSRISKFGTSCMRNADMWQIGRNLTVVTLNGITVGEWLWTTALTSGRAL